MEQNIKEISEIAFLNTGLLLLGESDQKIYARISYASLESIQGMAFHLGGVFEIYKTETLVNTIHCFGFFMCDYSIFTNQESNRAELNDSVAFVRYRFGNTSYFNGVTAFNWKI